MRHSKNRETTFPKKIIAKAQKMVDEETLFYAAEAALQKAVENKDVKTEKFLRRVFGAYVRLIAKQGTDADQWHSMNNAAGYAIGALTPGEPDIVTPPETEIEPVPRKPPAEDDPFL